MAPGFKKNHASKKSTAGSYRIIGGTWRSRRLSFPAIEGLRPTTDRVRETLFNWVQHDLHGARVLDAFAGSGALGLEALSRGASHAVMIEQDKRAAASLQSNVAALGAAADVVQQNALIYLQRGAQQIQQQGDNTFDLVLLDPPFRQHLLQPAIDALHAGGWCARNALVYIEAGTDEASPQLPADWQLYREKTAGQVCYALFTVAGASE